MFKSCTISLQIKRPFAHVYAFLVDPQQLPNWFPIQISDLIRIEEDRWQLLGPQGRRTLTFTGPNRFGILDFVVEGPDQLKRQFVVRAFPNGEGTEVHYTLLQLPGLSDERFASEVEWFRSDLSALKSHLEAEA